MKYIKFNEVEYSIVFDPKVIDNRFNVIIFKDNYTLDSIIEEIQSSEAITIIENGEVIGIYNGFTEFIAASVYPCLDNYQVNIELQGSSIEEQIETLTNSVSSLSEQVAEQANAIEELTPYTDTKKAYFGETEKTFYDVPEGNVSVFFDNYNGSYSVNRIENRLVVSFDALEEETNITISIK